MKYSCNDCPTSEPCNLDPGKIATLGRPELCPWGTSGDQKCDWKMVNMPYSEIVETLKEYDTPKDDPRVTDVVNVKVKLCDKDAVNVTSDIEYDDQVCRHGFKPKNEPKNEVKPTYAQLETFYSDNIKTIQSQANQLIQYRNENKSLRGDLSDAKNEIKALGENLEQYRNPENSTVHYSEIVDESQIGKLQRFVDESTKPLGIKIIELKKENAALKNELKNQPSTDEIVNGCLSKMTNLVADKEHLRKELRIYQEHEAVENKEILELYEQKNILESTMTKISLEAADKISELENDCAALAKDNQRFEEQNSNQAKWIGEIQKAASGLTTKFSTEHQ